MCGRVAGRVRRLPVVHEMLANRYALAAGLRDGDSLLRVRAERSEDRLSHECH